MFIITVKHWTAMTALQVLYDLGATLLVMYLLAIALTGWFGKHQRKEVRGGLAGGHSALSQQPSIQ